MELNSVKCLLHPGHNVIKLTEEQEMVVDQLVFCQIAHRQTHRAVLPSLSDANMYEV